MASAPASPLAPAEHWRWWQAWLLGVGSTAVLYSLGGLTRVRPSLLNETGVDRLIGFHPEAVWVYVSFFVMQATGFFCVPMERRLALTKAFVASATIAFVIFMVWPSTLYQPPLANGASWALSFVRGADTPGNCLPSLHAALSALSAAAMSLRRRAIVAVGAWVWALAICWSAIATRQHLCVDIAAGWILGCGMAFVFLRKRG